MKEKKSSFDAEKSPEKRRRISTWMRTSVTVCHVCKKPSVWYVTEEREPTTREKLSNKLEDGYKFNTRGKVEFEVKYSAQFVKSGDVLVHKCCLNSSHAA